jgi:hypothetical protein
VQRHRNNENFAQLRGALGLSPDEVVACCAAAGFVVSADRARRWSRQPDAGAGRYSPMSDEEFDAFCRGVSRWTYQERQREETRRD